MEGLGSRINLSGFSDVESAAMIVVKKLVGNHVKHLVQAYGDLDAFDLHHKDVHGNQHEVALKVVMQGKIVNASSTDRNLFVAIDSVLKKSEEEIKKK